MGGTWGSGREGVHEFVSVWPYGYYGVYNVSGLHQQSVSI